MTNVALIGLDSFEAPRAEMACDAEGALALIHRTAETVLDLQEANALVEARERACRVELERDRASWREDLDELRRTVEDCLERTLSAEKQAEEAETRIRLAIRLCGETRAREKAAIKRAEDAEQRLARLRESLSSEFSQIVSRGFR